MSGLCYFGGAVFRVLSGLKWRQTHTYAYMLNTKPALCQPLLKQGKDTSGEESSFIKSDFRLDVHPFLLFSRLVFTSLLLFEDILFYHGIVFLSFIFYNRQLLCQVRIHAFAFI